MYGPRRGSGITDDKGEINVQVWLQEVFHINELSTINTKALPDTGRIQCKCVQMVGVWRLFCANMYEETHWIHHVIGRLICLPRINIQ